MNYYVVAAAAEYENRHFQANSLSHGFRVDIHTAVTNVLSGPSARKCQTQIY